MTQFASAKQFLFLYQANLPVQDIQLIKEFAQEIKAEKKEVFFIVYHDFKKVPDGTVTQAFDTHISKADFNLFGNPKSSHLLRHTQIEYDYLFSFLDQQNPRLENFIKKTIAKVKIGRFEPHKKNLYRITFSTQDNPKSMESFLSMAGNYLTKIHF